MTDRIDTSNIAVLRAIGGANATSVTPAQVHAFADGLAGHPRDGKIDKVEAAAALEVARWSKASVETRQALRAALDGGTASIAIPQSPSSPTRFPGYLDVASLELPDERIPARALVLHDASGNLMSLSYDATAPRAITARFARAGEDPDFKAPMQLTPAEADAVALQMVRSIAARAAKAPEPRDRDFTLFGALAKAKIIDSASNEHDLSGYSFFDHWVPTDPSDFHVGVETATVAANLKARFTHTKDNVLVSYSEHGGPWSADRNLTKRELASLKQAQEISDLGETLYHHVGREDSVLGEIWMRAMNPPQKNGE